MSETKLTSANGMVSSSVQRVLRIALATVLAGLVFTGSGSTAEAQQRVLGIDVSAWQGNLSQTTWNNLHNINDRDFVFIRSSRGGTTGFYNQSDATNDNGLNTFSQRYDDPYLWQNITLATNAGMFAGPYHFARPDIIASTLNAGGIANTGVDEADHFIQMAGAWMRPGYLLPVFDLEAGQAQRTNNELAQFSVDFGNRIYDVMGIRPAIYTNGSYANDLQGASAALEDAVVAAFPTLWSARWPNQSDPDSIPVQTAHPKDSYTPIYGPWDDAPNPTHPWSFWQYASTAWLSGYNNGNSNIDVNVAQGGMEFLKDHLVPALWTTDSDGQWTTLSNWNSGQTPVAPVQGPGQVPRVGRGLSLPAVRLPAFNDTVVLDRLHAGPTITLDSGSHEIRKLEVREALDITGGSLTVNYVPSADSTPIAAQFSAPVMLSGGSLSVHTLQVDATQTFSLSGALTFDTIHLMPHSSTPAKIDVIGDVNFSPLDDAAAAIVNGAGAGSSGLIDLGGANRGWQVSNGAAAVDLSIEVPIVNGALTKSGAGTLVLIAASSYAGDTSVVEGTLSLNHSLLADAADVYLSTGALIDLNFDGAPDVVDALMFDGVSQSVGMWGAVGSGAQFVSPLITGTGLLQVSTQVASIPGDFNHDGVVNSNDLTQWQGDYGQNGNSDADGDGDSDGTEFLIWQRGYGLTSQAGNVNGDADSNGVVHGQDLSGWQKRYGIGIATGSESVPEPWSVGLAMGAMLTTALEDRKRQRVVAFAGAATFQRISEKELRTKVLSDQVMPSRQ